jgi:predicted PurR-regulated permease PerM
LRDFDKLKAFIIRIVPEKSKESFLGFMWQADQVLSGYFRGVLIMCCVEGSLVAFGLSLIGLPYAVLFGVITGLAYLVPYIGALIGAVPAVLVASFTDKPLEMVILTIVIYVTVVIIDSNVIAPRIIGRRVGLHPVLVLFFIMVGAKFLGAAGFFLATPVAGVAKIAITDLWRRHHGLPPAADKTRRPLGKGGIADRLKRKRKG